MSSPGILLCRRPEKTTFADLRRMVEIVEGNLDTTEGGP
jgi:hypothetical protein